MCREHSRRARRTSSQARIDMNLATAFAESARHHGAKTAVYWGEQEIAYDTLLGASRHVAHQLVTEFAIQPGDRVALWMKNCPEFVPGYFGVLFAGGVVVSINNFLKADEVKFILDDA